MAEADISIPSPTVFLRKSPPSTASAAPIDDQPRAPKYARKATTAPKKATFRKSGSSTTGEVKQKQSKSRNGCVTCKAKRLKCDEEKPTCQQCAKRKVECGGYRKDFKWRPFEETNVKLVVDRQKRPSPSRQVSGLKSQDVSPPPEPQDAVALPIQSRPARPSHARTCSVDGTQVKLADFHLPVEQGTTDLEPRDEKLTPIAEVARSPTPAGPPLSPLSLEPKSVPISGISAQIAQAREQGALPTTPASGSPIPLVGPSPTLTELLLPFTPRTLGTHADYISFSMPEDFQFPISPQLNQESIFDDLTNSQEPPTDAGALSRSAEDVQLIWQNRYTTPPPSRSSDTTLETRLRLWGADNHLYNQPFLAEDSLEMLSIRYDKLTCGILSIMDGPTENPWRTLVWPLAQDSPALLHALLAMTAFHSASDVPSLRVVGHEHKDKSFGFIQEGIRDRSMTDQKAIATALALGFTESWDQHTATGNSHIKGAQALVKRTLAEHQTNPLNGVELARLKFLVNAWVYMDVIARITSVDSDYSNDFDNTFLFSSEAPPLVMGGPGPPGFGIDFGIGIDARIDPLMGCANTLFPLIGRVANLVKRVCRSTTTSPGLIGTASELKDALESWQPPSFIEPPEDPTSQVQHSIQTAEAYRWATLLHLHRSVPELPSPSAEDLSQKSLSYLATVPLTSRTTNVHLYPLMLAGCEASTYEDRAFVRSRWTAITQRKRTGAADKCAIVTEEVWRRKDAYALQSPTSRNRLVETAQVSPVRRHGEPLKRTRGGFEEADPGRKGMVFTWIEGFDDEGIEGSPPGGRIAKNGFPPRPRYVENIGGMEPAYTVRGHLHFVGVMWDWGYEILLG